MDKAKICKVRHWIWKWAGLISLAVTLAVIGIIFFILITLLVESQKEKTRISAFNEETVIAGTVAQDPIKLGPGIYVVGVNLVPDNERAIRWALISVKYPVVRGQRVKVQIIFIHESNQGYSEEVRVIQNE